MENAEPGVMFKGGKLLRKKLVPGMGSTWYDIVLYCRNSVSDNCWFQELLVGDYVVIGPVSVYQQGFVIKPLKTGHW